MGSFVSIGECMVELSDPNGDRWRVRYAGDTFNTAFVVRALSDGPVRYLTAFGDDAFSDRMRREMHDLGIATDGCQIVPGKATGLYAIELDGAERSFSYWRSDSAARRLAADSNELANALTGVEWIYLSGITVAIVLPEHRANLIAALSAAREQGARVAFDPNHRPKLWSAEEANGAARQLLPFVDLVMTGMDDEAALGRPRSVASIYEHYRSLGVAQVVVKDGERGYWLDVDEHFEAETVVNAVDTTGAGDAFNGGILAAMSGQHLQQAALRKAAAVGARVAAATVTIHGARAPAESLRAAAGRAS